ncbi:MAG: hypothetical protein KIT84_32340 [Labilithrix sp.]|nr:hypothetical protein [Labilithrix sp.]MCW5815763.1 hypothetical protein [Labilithrix sp.]
MGRTGVRRALLVVLVVLTGLVELTCCRVGAADGALSPVAIEEERRDREESVGAGYDVFAAPPFVVVAQNGMRAEATATIEWARDRLRADFFDKEPGKVLTIFVFADEASYRSGSSALLDVVPDTPYGFFRPCKRALVVDSAYGWGTLVHELVHAYVGADFPSAPTWLNEGLGSLFERPIDVEGHIRGATNWRLAELQQAIRERRSLSFETMAGGSRLAFDGKRGSLYTFRDHPEGDGLPALRRVTGVADLDALRRRWETDVLALSYAAPNVARR